MRPMLGRKIIEGKEDDLPLWQMPIAYNQETPSDYDREKLQERLAKLAGDVAVISVGAATETEMKEKKARVEDALHATRAAVEEGVVAGGLVAYLRTQKALGDEAVGAGIVCRALEFPTRQLADNAGQEGALIVQEVKKRSGSEGFNVAIGKYEDPVKAGVVDPAKVVRTALQNAARSPLSCSPQKHW